MKKLYKNLLKPFATKFVHCQLLPKFSNICTSKKNLDISMNSNTQIECLHSTVECELPKVESELLILSVNAQAFSENAQS